MSRKFHTYTKNNIVHVDPVLEADEAIIAAGSPSHTTTPYDVYARFIRSDAAKCFAISKIPAEVHTCHRRVASVHHGSGPDGRVRFGDDMIPPEILAVVKKTDEARARAAWEAYTYRKFQVPKPYTLSHRKWWDGTKWNTGNTWRMVQENAVAIATGMRLPADRLLRVIRRARKYSNATNP